MSPLLVLMIVVSIVLVVILTVALIIGSVRKSAERAALLDLSLPEIQARAIALRERVDNSGSAPVASLTSLSLFSPEYEALFEALLQKTFTGSEDLDSAHQELVTHFVWHLGQLSKYLQQNWPWPETPTITVHRLAGPETGYLIGTLGWLQKMVKKHEALAELYETTNEHPAWRSDIFEWESLPGQPGTGAQNTVEVRCSPNRLEEEISRLAAASAA